MKYVLIILLLFSQLATPQELVILSSEPTLTRQRAYSIFLADEYTFLDGSRVKMVVLPRDHITTKLFARNLGITPTRLFDKVETAFSTGRLNLLYVAESDRDAYRYILKTNGVIGYVQDYVVSDVDMLNIIRYRGY